MPGYTKPRHHVLSLKVWYFSMTQMKGELKKRKQKWSNHFYKSVNEIRLLKGWSLIHFVKFPFLKGRMFIKVYTCFFYFFLQVPTIGRNFHQISNFFRKNCF
uniref:Uncharacterized protein n=1 Tax=Cacopsylla melanoneura TaxID=428564 RepID=A0A8D8WNP7_9HEMI